MKLKQVIVPLTVALALAACGDDDDPTLPGATGNGTGTFTATIDGVAWQCDANHIQVTGPAAVATREGTISISGYQSSNGRGVQLLLSFIHGAATVPLGVNVGTNAGGVGSVLVGGNTWLTPLSGEAGTVTITDRTDTHLAGTFEFTSMTQAPGSGPDTREVTNGRFDITVEDGLPLLPTGTGSSCTATIDGLAFNAATVVGGNIGDGAFNVMASNLVYTLVIYNNVSAAVDSLAIATDVSMEANRTTTPDEWTAQTDNSGVFVITTLEAHRLVASFEAHLDKIGGGNSLNILNATLNVHLENDP